MNKYYYQHNKSVSLFFIARIFGLVLFIIGISTMAYIFSPLIIWQLTLAPAFADSQVAVPIPKKILLTPMTMKSLLAASVQNVSGIDYTNAANWFPGYAFAKGSTQHAFYFLSIPKLSINNAYVSTVDTNLASHLVSLFGTAVPPEKGNTVIFGHSTLPQLYNEKDYKTIFANIYKLQIGDIFTTTVDNIVYTYKIFSITVVDPEDTDVLSQQFDDSYVTLITCTPPGTIWKRLIIKARIMKLEG